MPNTAKLTIDVQNQINGVGIPSGSVVFVMGKTKRGPANDASKLINSPQQFIALFGGEISTSYFPTLALAMLTQGIQLRVCSVKNTPVKATAIPIIEGANTLFSLAPKYAGVDYNSLRFVISDASNGNAAYFNLAINHVLEPELNELYQNLTIVGKPTVASSTYLDDVKKRSKLADVTYADISIITGTTFRPTSATYTVVGGTDGSAVANSDYIGVSASKTGFYAFNDYNEAYWVIAPEISDETVHIAGAAYAKLRGDIEYGAHLDNSNTDAASYVSDRALTTEDHPYYALYGGGLTVASSDGNNRINISELAHVIIQFCKTASNPNLGPWWSFAGPKRGNISGALGVVNNFGSPASYNDLNQLANNQINMVTVQDGVVRISGNFTGQKAFNQQSYLSIQMLVLFLVKTLRPVLELYKEDPTDIPTFVQIFHHIRPFMKDLAKKEKRCLWGWAWLGDQDAKSLDDLQVNTKEDVLMGKYKMKLKITPIASMQEMTLSIVLTTEGVQFSTE